MLYRDYSRAAGEWIPNIYGGRENLEAIDFLRHLNAVVAERCPGAVDDRRGIDRLAGRHPAGVAKLGLGFSYKWNMGWMHDTLRYMAQRSDPSPLSSRRHDLRPALRLLGALHPAAVARRGRARQRARCSARMPGDRWQTLRQSARLFRLHVGASRQEAAVHGRRDRAGARMEPRRRARLAPARRSRPCRHAAPGARSQPPLSRASRRCMRATASPTASAGSSATIAPTRCSPSCARARRATRPSWSSAT